MADVFELVGSALQLAELALTVINNCVGYYRGVRRAREEARVLQDEFYGLFKILRDIQGILEEAKEPSGMPPNLGSIAEEFDGTRALLKDAIKYTSPEQTQGLRVLEWPFKRTATKDLIKRIQERKSSLNLVLHGASQYISSLKMADIMQSSVVEYPKRRFRNPTERSRFTTETITLKPKNGGSN